MCVHCGGDVLALPAPVQEVMGVPEYSGHTCLQQALLMRVVSEPTTQHDVGVKQAGAPEFQ